LSSFEEVNTTQSTILDDDAELLNRSAARAALGSIESFSVESTSLVSYHSRGRLLIISGDAARARPIHREFADKLSCCVLSTGEEVPEPTLGFPAMFAQGREIRIRGHLGAFTVTVVVGDEEVNVAGGFAVETDCFDLILDLGTPPLLTWEVPPFGYYAPGEDGVALAKALAELPDLVGEFEKPKYFDYNPNICAHGNSGLKGCSRCLDACPAGAITSLIDKIAVDPYFCQGGGSCATACPTGAIVYSFPKPADTVDRLRILLRAYRENGGRDPVLLFHDGVAADQCVASAAERLPAHIMALGVEEIGSVGLDVWLPGLAFGAGRILILETAQVPAKVSRELAEQLGIARSLLEAMGYPPSALARIQAADPQTLLDQIQSGDPMPPITPAGFAGANEKRRSIFNAIDHLRKQAPNPAATVALPHGAPFGEVAVDRDACTLCMACVSVCPASALYDGADTPRLDFLESNCVQCGLCQSACPEDAVTCHPRFLFNPEERRQRRVLNEEPAFHCIACGAPFATRSMIETMEAKLRGHSMFQDNRSLRRLKLCGECRVRDMFADDE
jgi:ferredoxin